MDIIGQGQKSFFFGKAYSWVIIVLVMVYPLRGNAQWVAPDSLDSFSLIKQDLNHDNKSDNIGKEVTVSGIANVASGLFHEVYLQIYIQNDSTSLLLFRNTIDEQVSVGDSVVAKGKVQLYFSEPEVLVDNYHVYHNAKSKLHTVALFKAMRDSSRYYGMLVKGTGIIRDKGFKYNGKYLTISPSDTSKQRINVYVSNFNAQYHNFDFATPRVGDVVTVTGVVGQYNTKSIEPYVVYLRTPEDFSYAGFPQYYLNYLIIILLVLILAGGGWMIALRLQVKRKTQALEDSLAEKKILLKEIHHRVKNNLAIISGLLELQKGTSENDEVQNALQDSQSRISSMAMVHEKLYRSDSVSAIAVETYLKELVETIHNTFSEVDSGIIISIMADAVDLDIDQVLPLGLLVNELVTNSLKHAFKDAVKGNILIELQKKQDDITLKVEDDGIGLSEEFAQGNTDSLGMLLIETFAKQLEATKSVTNTPGACFIFCFKKNKAKTD